MVKTYTIVYRPTAMCGEPGFNYEIRTRGRLVAEGWSRGKKRNAEEQAREAINARDTLRGLAGVA